MKKLVIFDMDGTICDSWPCIEHCYKQTIKSFDKNISDDEFVKSITGSLSNNLKRMLNVDDKELDKAREIFRKNYEENRHAMVSPFKDIPSLIRSLHSKYAIGIATMMYQPYAVDTLKRFGILDCVDIIQGSYRKIEREKSDMIKICMEKTGVSAKNTVMIGDSFSDLDAAKDAGVGFIAVTYGYGITVSNCNDIKYVLSPEGIDDALYHYWQE